MSDNDTIEVTDEVTPEVAQPAEPNGEATDANAEESVDYWKSRARSWERQAKDKKDAAAKWEDYQKSLKTIEEQRAEEMNQIQRQLEEERAQRIRLEVASERGITGDAVKLLDGKSREEIEEKADALLELMEVQSKPKQPRPDSNQGQSGSGVAKTSDLFAQAIENII
jgi:uncharacterized protein involved in type VI secretion and phage assembly